MVEVMKIMVISLKRSQASTAIVHAPTLQQATNDPCLCQRLLDTHRQVSCGVTVPFSCVLAHKVLFMEQQTGSKSGKEYVKAVYCHPAYLTSMQSTS